MLNNARRLAQAVFAMLLLAVPVDRCCVPMALVLAKANPAVGTNAAHAASLWLTRVIVSSCAAGICAGNDVKALDVFMPLLVPLAPNTPPTVSLVGPAVISIPSGSVYDKCNTTSSLDAVCERGVVAKDVEDGAQRVCCENQTL